MKNVKLLCGLIFLIGMGISISAAAHHGHFHHHGPRIGFAIGGSLWWPGPGYYAPYYYPYPPIVTTPAPPPVYIEQSQASSASTASQSAYWYYCDHPQGYYPYIKQCSDQWQKVAPVPPTQ
ncbi:MAG TPA: hypothetical protein VIF82_03390 [Burkholderiaceae bacterium]